MGVLARKKAEKKAQTRTYIHSTSPAQGSNEEAAETAGGFSSMKQLLQQTRGL